MNREEILNFLNTNPASHFATTDGNQPRVRGLMMYKADSTGIYYHTAKCKPLYRQITENKGVEICFNSQDAQVRVEGFVEILDDDNLKKEMLSARPYLQSLIDHGGNDALIAFRVTGCKACVWTPGTNLEPTKYIDI